MDESNDTASPRHQGRSAELEIRTSASPERIWNAWADPEKISQWFVDRAEGWAHKGAEVTWFFDEFGYRLPYQVVDSVPGERIVYGGQVPGRIPFLLEVTLRRDGGETIIRLVNSGFLEGGSFDEEYEGVASGWQLALAMLKYYAEHHYGVEKEQHLLMRPGQIDLPSLPAWYTRPELLNAWLTTAAEVGSVGEPCLLALRNGPVVKGTVAAISRREAAFVWPAENAMIELKGWAAGDKKLLAIRLTGWKSPLVGHVLPVLRNALDRLAVMEGTAAIGGQ